MSSDKEHRAKFEAGMLVRGEYLTLAPCEMCVDVAVHDGCREINAREYARKRRAREMVRGE